MIPTLDEAQTIEAALRSVRHADTRYDADRHADARRLRSPIVVGVWVVDGGSRDETCARARNAGARVIELSRNDAAGRARQLQAGFAACDGDTVLFLHADTRLAAGWEQDVAAALSDPGVVGGAFRFHFDRGERPSPFLRAVEWGARVRSRWFGLPYGDQAIFARRAALERLGGVPQAPIMEDLDLVDALKREGRLVLLESPATTSARRYRAHGTLRTFLRNALALGAWRLGLDRERVARWYRR